MVCKRLKIDIFLFTIKALNLSKTKTQTLFFPYKLQRGRVFGFLKVWFSVMPTSTYRFFKAGRTLFVFVLFFFNFCGFEERGLNSAARLILAYPLLLKMRKGQEKSRLGRVVWESKNGDTNAKSRFLLEGRAQA